jgi:serine/threonine protein kinase
MGLGDLVTKAQRRVGTMLRHDKYTLEALIGVGAMGAVYAAHHRNGMRIAIKVLHSELSRHEDVRRRFLREGYLANRVAHPGVVKILDDDVDDDGTTFLVMELLTGATLEAESQNAKAKLSVARVADVVDRLLEVLDAIHAEGIVHRDVKPENVFLTDTGQLKLLDLGIARIAESRGITATGQMMGTPEFVAPEQAGGRVKEIDARTDVYSVGAMTFTLLTAELVHPATTPMERMILAATTPARSIFDVWPNAPPALANVIDVALSFDMDKRWASAREMRVALGRTMSLYGAPARIEDASMPSTPMQQHVAGPLDAHRGTGTLLVGKLGQSADDSDATPLSRRKE